MSKNFAVVENNIVINVIVADDDFAQMYSASPDCVGECVEYFESNPDDTLVARIGEAYLNGKFVNGNQAVELGLLTIVEASVFGFHSGQEYKEQLNPTSQSITKIQTMRVLKLHGLWEQFNSLLASNQDAMDEWTLAVEVKRNNPFVIQLAPSLGVTDAQMDELFIEASKL
jgi:hypothetical protein